MKPQAQILTGDFTLGICPACNVTIAGHVDVSVTPEWTLVDKFKNNHVTVSVKTSIVGFRTEHTCSTLPQPSGPSQGEGVADE